MLHATVVVILRTQTTEALVVAAGQQRRDPFNSVLVKQQKKCKSLKLFSKPTNTGKTNLKLILDHLPNPCSDVYLTTFRDKYQHTT